MLQYRNTPCRFLNQSPAQILFARKLKDGIPCEPSTLKLRSEWIKTAAQREVMLAKKHVIGGEVWSRGVRDKDRLKVGDNVSVQALAGKGKNLWNLSGAVVDVAGPESYWVRLNGSGHLTK